MHDFLVSNVQTILWILSVIELGFVLVFFYEFSKRKMPVAACMMLLTAGLFVDAFLLALGGTIGELPKFISMLRFICHGALLPLVFPICGYGLKLNKTAMKVLWIFTAIVMVAGLAQALSTDLVVATVGDNIRHISSVATPAWAKTISRLLSFGTIIPLIISGVIVWIKSKTPCLFLAGGLMFVFAALGPATGNMDLIFLISMFGEIAMVIFYYLYLVSDRANEKELELCAQEITE